MLLQPKNWAVFQHYKDRCPPWIKLHRDLLNDRAYMCLPIASKALAPLLWLLASETKDGQFDGSLDELVFRLHISPKDYEDGLKPLIDKGFFIVTSGVLAERKHVAIPETETERETKTEKKATVVATPDGVSDNLWKEFKALRKLKKAPITDRVIESIKAEADKAGWTLEKALGECVTRGWQAFKAEWVQGKANLADVARITVPGNKDRDPTLIKIENDRKLATPPPPEILAKIQALKGRTYG